MTSRSRVRPVLPVPAHLRGRHLVATDTDRAVGAGPRVEGPVDALLLLLTGRTHAVDRLSGEGVTRP